MVAVARGKPLPAPDEVPADLDQMEEQTTQVNPKDSTAERSKDISEQVLHNLTVPIKSRAQSFNSDSSTNQTSSNALQGYGASASSSTLMRGRAKTLTSIAMTSKNASQSEMQPREIQLPPEPNYNGQPIEAYLYKDASECPICFLHYPPYLNKTRCCDQAICSECFVQIKRPNPHPPEHGDSTQPQAPRVDAHMDPEQALVSEPVACPFCALPEFGVTYEPPPFRRGLAHAPSGHPLAKSDAATASSSSVNSGSLGGELSSGRRRATSLAVNDPAVVTTDKIRPDWAGKLASARAHAARRSAAATALHTAAYLMGNRNGGSDSRFFGRRGMLRRGIGSESPSERGSSQQLNLLDLMSARYGLPPNENGEIAHGDTFAEGTPTMLGPPRQSSRRNRVGVEDLEEMMMLEAIRLSLAAEEDRRKKEEKDAKKESKKKAKEDKKTEKAAKKANLYLSSGNPSSRTLGGESSSKDMGKGKLHARQDYTGAAQSSKAASLPDSGESAQSYLEKSRAQILQSDSPQSPNFPSAPFRPSHLRNLSNVSSSASSINEQLGRNRAGSISSLEPSPSASGIHLAHSEVPETLSGTPPGGGAGMEPMFNFSSLTAMVDGGSRSGSPLIEHGDNPALEASDQSSLDMENLNAESNEGNASTTTLDHESDPLAQSVATLRAEEQISPVQPSHNNELSSKEREVNGLGHETGHQQKMGA